MKEYYSNSIKFACWKAQRRHYPNIPSAVMLRELELMTDAQALRLLEEMLWEQQQKEPMLV